MKQTGIKIISLLFIIFGILWLSSGALLIAMFEESESMYSIVKEQLTNETITPEMFKKMMTLISTLTIILGIISVIIGWGLWNFYNWARIGAIVFLGFGALSGMISALVQPFFVVEVFINLIIIWYLMRRDVIEAFNKKRNIEEEILGNEFN